MTEALKLPQQLKYAGQNPLGRCCIGPVGDHVRAVPSGPTFLR